MKKATYIILTFITLHLICPNLVNAQSSDLLRLLRKQKTSSGPGSAIGISPLIVRKAFKPGNSDQFKFTVHNYSTAHMAISAKFGGVKIIGADVVFIPLAKLTRNHIARWTTMKPNPILLPPRSKKNLIFHVNVPQELEGTNVMQIILNGGVITKPQEWKRDPRKRMASVGISAGVIATAIIDIAGKTTYSIELKSAEITKKGSSYRAEALVKSTGNGSLLLQLWGSIFKEGVKTPIATFRRISPVPIGPNTELKITSSWLNQDIPKGKYKASIIITDQDEKMPTQTKDFDTTIH